MNIKENNGIISGVVANEPEMYECHGRKYYAFNLITTRQSGTADIVCVNMCSEIGIVNLNDKIQVKGEIRTYNKTVNGKNKLVIVFFATEITTCFNGPNQNIISLQGYICKSPIIRKTPLGRQICDVMLAVHRIKKSDYIPCIFWGINAQTVSNLQLGTKVNLVGRFQSRKYNKSINEIITEFIAYEVSANQIFVEE